MGIILNQWCELRTGTRRLRSAPYTISFLSAQRARAVLGVTLPIYKFHFCLSPLIYRYLNLTKNFILPRCRFKLVRKSVDKIAAFSGLKCKHSVYRRPVVLDLGGLAGCGGGHVSSCMFLFVLVKMSLVRLLIVVYSQRRHINV